MLTGNISSYIKPKSRNSSRPKKNAEARGRRRFVVSGFPVKPTKFSKQEIDEYFSGEKIQCLLCGRQFKSLSIHLLKIHSVTGDEYRDLYGLPWMRGLTSSEYRDRRSNMMKLAIEEGTRKLPDQTIGMEAARNSILANGMRNAPFQINDITARALKVHGRTEQLGDDAFQEFVRRVAAGRSITSVLEDADMPGRSWVYQYMRNVPGARESLRLEIEKLPFATQAEMGCLGEGFLGEVQRRHKAGDSDHAIGRSLGVTATSVNRWRRGLIGRNSGTIAPVGTTKTSQTVES